ncbi:MAG: general secretion pathway protein GspK [Candidatus Omnitrophica bacterium]|nr:general secretion pathway protein GspK [Candidatus Omnitrophota bacterium]MCF7878944.1 general secretion pathway protein GspK [Candidatus Omnitrophota bacterium]
MIFVRKKKKSSVLVLTLWILSLLVVFSIGIGQNVRAHLNFASHIKKRVKNYYMAKGGIEKAIAVLESDQDLGVDNLSESWANDQDLFKQLPLNGGYLTISYTLDNGGQQQVLYGVEDECSKININKVSKDILSSLLERIGGLESEQAIDVAAAIKDWRDADQLVSLGGAEENYYQGLKEPYQCSDSEFELVEELLFVKGMTQELFSKIKKLVTVYGQGKININTVDALTLYALGLNKDFAQRIIEYRQGSDLKDGTEDDNLFQSVGAIRGMKALFTEESTQLNTLISKNLFTVVTNTFRINSLAKTRKEEGGVGRYIECVVKRDKGNQSEIVYWRER